MKNKKTLYILGGLALLTGVYFFIEKNKKNNSSNTNLTSNSTSQKSNCPNGTKKVQINCIKAPCPEMEVCA